MWDSLLDNVSQRDEYLLTLSHRSSSTAADWGRHREPTRRAGRCSVRRAPESGALAGGHDPGGRGTAPPVGENDARGHRTGATLRPARRADGDGSRLRDVCQRIGPGLVSARGFGFTVHRASRCVTRSSLGRRQASERFGRCGMRAREPAPSSASSALSA